MSLRTNEQNARFHQLITFHKLDKDEKRALIEEVSNGRVTSSKDLSRIEMAKAIQTLDTQKNETLATSRKKMMAKAINLARELGMVTGEGSQVNFDGLNALGNRMYKVEKFFGLTNEQIQNVITGLMNLKKNRKDEKNKVDANG